MYHNGVQNVHKINNSSYIYISYINARKTK